MVDQQQTARLIAEPDLMTLAACGDLVAQRKLCTLSIEAYNEGRATFWEAMSWAMTFAQLAMAHGNLCDKGTVLNLLSLMGDAAQEMGDSARIHAYEVQALEVLRDGMAQAKAEGLPDYDAMFADFSRLVDMASDDAIAEVVACDAAQAPVEPITVH